MPSLVRRLTRTRSKLARLIITIALSWTFLEVLYVRLHTHEVPPPTPAPKGSRIFITGLAWNSEPVLRGFWNDALVNLVHTLGAHNVYVSISESGSYWDETKEALAELRTKLDHMGVANTITTSDRTHDDVDSDLIKVPAGDMRARRIPYLAGLRNQALKPLWAKAREGEWFDKVLFLNDVMFTTADVLRLLDTNDGSYAAACALDFKHPPAYYDTFALRELDGREPENSAWPFFGLSGSRHDLKLREPILVKSCWNGMVVMKADPFYGEKQSLEFRALPLSLAEKHLEASECCLIHADNPLSASLGVWVNPNVRVGYSKEAYVAVQGHQWPSPLDMARGLWNSRLSRMIFWPSNQRSIHRRVSEWKIGGAGRSEPGEFCINDEMQVLVTNGWAHV